MTLTFWQFVGALVLSYMVVCGGAILLTLAWIWVIDIRTRRRALKDIMSDERRSPEDGSA